MVAIDSLDFGVLTARDMKFVPKRWGYELWIVNNEKYCGKILFIKAGQKCSVHKHLLKDETLYISHGICDFIYINQEAFSIITIKEGEAFHVTPGLLHQMRAVTDVTIFEFSTQHFDEDSYRLEDTDV